MDNHYERTSINYNRLKDLPRESRIESLYKHTPHSLSRVCLQCIEIGYETSMNPEEIVSDMVYAVDYFGEKARLGDVLAINTLGRFSHHITGSGRLRYTYIAKLAADKAIFDNELSNIYEKVISSLHEKPVYKRFVKDVTHETSKNIVSVIDNSDIPQSDEQY